MDPEIDGRRERKKLPDEQSMRKRVVIGLAVIAVLAVGSYVLSQPRRGTVEYHKKEYLSALNGPSFSERIQRTVRRIMGKAHVFAGISGERLNQMRQHQNALIELGFLERREMVLTNLPDMPHVKHLQWSVFSEAPGPDSGGETAFWSVHR